MSYTQRSNNSPNPMFGNLNGFSLGDLPAGYVDPIVALTTVKVDTTSPVINHGGNGIQLTSTFSDGTTTCSIDVTDANGVLFKTFNNVSLTNEGNLFVTYFDIGKLLQGAPVKVRAYNFTGTGTVSINVRKTS